jgi:hypothetical protein
VGSSSSFCCCSSSSCCRARTRLGLAASQVPPRPSSLSYRRARPHCPPRGSVSSRHASVPSALPTPCAATPPRACATPPPDTSHMGPYSSRTSLRQTAAPKFHLHAPSARPRHQLHPLQLRSPSAEPRALGRAYSHAVARTAGSAPAPRLCTSTHPRNFPTPAHAIRTSRSPCARLAPTRPSRWAPLRASPLARRRLARVSRAHACLGAARVAGPHACCLGRPAPLPLRLGTVQAEPRLRAPAHAPLGSASTCRVPRSPSRRTAAPRSLRVGPPALAPAAAWAGLRLSRVRLGPAHVSAAAASSRASGSRSPGARTPPATGRPSPERPCGATAAPGACYSVPASAYLLCEERNREGEKEKMEWGDKDRNR